MARIVPLFSGSKGNCYYIGTAAEGVLIDAGRNCKQIELAMEANGLSMKSVGAVFVTHEHIDHCSALKVLAKKAQPAHIRERRHPERPCRARQARSQRQNARYPKRNRPRRHEDSAR